MASNNTYSLDSDALREIHTGLAESLDGYQMPDMGFGAKVASIEENLDYAAQELGMS
ncbi:MAG: hypothetical protein ACRBDL_02605 [Alphaproteobacteria bacterium]